MALAGTKRGANCTVVSPPPVGVVSVKKIKNSHPGPGPHRGRKLFAGGDGTEKDTGRFSFVLLV